MTLHFLIQIFKKAILLTLEMLWQRHLLPEPLESEEDSFPGHHLPEKCLKTYDIYMNHERNNVRSVKGCLECYKGQIVMSNSMYMRLIIGVWSTRNNLYLRAG